jgi:hypothetical protein
MIELHKYFLLGLNVIDLLLLNDIDLLHDLQGEDFTCILESYQFHTAECAIAECRDYLEQINMNIGIAHNDYISAFALSSITFLRRLRKPSYPLRR